MCHGSYTMSDSASCSPTRRRKRVGRSGGRVSWCSNAGGIAGRGGEGGKRLDRRLRGYFDELLRTHYLNSRPGVVARLTRDDFLCAPGHDGGTRSFTEESRYRAEHFAFFRRARSRTFAPRNLSNDRCKQSRGSTTRNDRVNCRGISRSQPRSRYQLSGNTTNNSTCFFYVRLYEFNPGRNFCSVILSPITDSVKLERCVEYS